MMKAKKFNENVYKEKNYFINIYNMKLYNTLTINLVNKIK